MRKRLLSLALALAACLSLTIAAQAVSVFSDVPSTHWAYAEIQKCCDQGIVNGYNDGTFGPAKTVTGAQFAAMLTRTFYPAELAANNGLSSQGWYMPALYTAYNANLLNGTSRLAGGRSDNWKSSANLTLNRYDMAQMLNNILAAKNVSASSDSQNAAKDAIKDWGSIPSQYQNAVLNCYALGVLNGMSDQTFSGNNTMNRAQACAVINRTVNHTASASGGQKPEAVKTHTLTIEYKKEGDEAAFQPTHTSKVQEGAAYSVPSPTVSGYTASQATVSGTMGTADVTVVVRYKPIASTAKTPEQLSAEIIELVNAERAKQGLSALGTFSALTSAAQTRAPELDQLFEHTRPSGKQFYTALDEARVSYYAAGENIAACSGSAETAMNLWMNSAGHRANILNKDFTHIGVACVKSSKGSGYYFVQVFVGSSTPSEGTTTQTPNTPEISLSISPTTLTLEVGSTGTVNAATNRSAGIIRYASSNQSVASVSSSGVVTAESVGSAVITASMSWQGKNYTAQCSVTVKAADTPAPAPEQSQTQSKTPEELSAEVVRLVNAERAKEGLSPLGTIDTLTAAAQIRAPELVKLFEHTRPDGRDCFTALDEAHVANVYLAGENIAAGSSTPEGVMQMWMNSPGHRGNILHKSFTHIGVACVKSSQGYFWVQMFISTPTTPSNSGTNPAPSSTPDADTPDTGSTNNGNNEHAGNNGNSGSNGGNSNNNGNVTVNSGERTTHYREDLGGGEYMEIEVVNGTTIRLSGCRNLNDSLYNAVVLWAFGDNVNYTAFHSGQPFSVSIDINVDRLLEIYDGDTTRATSHLTTLIAQNYNPRDKGTAAGISFRNVSAITLGLDGNGGIELQLRPR